MRVFFVIYIKKHDCLDTFSDDFKVVLKEEPSEFAVFIGHEERTGNKPKVWPASSVRRRSKCPCTYFLFQFNCVLRNSSSFRLLLFNLSCRPKAKRVPYFRQKNETRMHSSERRASGRVNPLADDILTQYEMNEMFFKVQQASWWVSFSAKKDWIDFWWLESPLCWMSNAIYTCWRVRSCLT